MKWNLRCQVSVIARVSVDLVVTSCTVLGLIDCLRCKINVSVNVLAFVVLCVVVRCCALLCAGVPALACASGAGGQNGCGAQRMERLGRRAPSTEPAGPSVARRMPGSNAHVQSMSGSTLRSFSHSLCTSSRPRPTQVFLQ